MLFDAINGLNRLINGLDAFTAAKMHAFNLERLDFGVFSARVVAQLKFGVAGLAEISGAQQCRGALLDRGSVRSANGDCTGVGIDFGFGVWHGGDRFFGTGDATFAAEMDAADFGAGVSGAR